MRSWLAVDMKSASEVVNEGLRLVEERGRPSCKGSENDLAVAINAGGEVSEIELDADLAELAVELKAKGVAPSGELTFLAAVRAGLSWHRVCGGEGRGEGSA